jgi:hypothetical protein
VGDSWVRYARNGDVRLAYRIFGDSGPLVRLNGLPDEVDVYRVATLGTRG